ncbi:MAG: hypothetical protein EOM37_00595 [Proteobacteria bacterium]|jgi:hypothetical protein|nr:hypothetical protein [Alphaproteobacteria bacterium]NCC02538.1 hypothetical protein [Pseudomonadota bacterium]
MSTSKAILLSALLIAFSLFVSQGLPQAHANTKGPFQLMNHSNTTANAGVFRLDTSTGAVSYCFVSEQSKLVCSQYVE